MTRSIAIAQEFTTFRQVAEKLGLSLSEDSQFFTEWMGLKPRPSRTALINCAMIFCVGVFHGK